MIKKIWSDPVWSKVIATAIVGGAAVLVSYFLDWWPRIGAILHDALDFTVTTTPVPHWLLILLGLMSLPLVLLILAGTWQFLRGSSGVASPWTDYTEDTFFHIQWRWKYDKEGHLRDINSFCPRCDYQVFPQNVSGYTAVDRIAFHCDSCGASLGEFTESYDLLESKVERFIQQKRRKMLREPAAAQKHLESGG